MRSPAYFLSCGIVADRGELEDVIVGADPGGALDHDVRLDRGAAADLDVVADDRCKAPMLSGADARGRIDERGRMDRSRFGPPRSSMVGLGDDLAVDLRAASSRLMLRTALRG